MEQVADLAGVEVPHMESGVCASDAQFPKTEILVGGIDDRAHGLGAAEALAHAEHGIGFRLVQVRLA